VTRALLLAGLVIGAVGVAVYLSVRTLADIVDAAGYPPSAHINRLLASTIR
jgi:hypothetical protein